MQFHFKDLKTDMAVFKKEMQTEMAVFKKEMEYLKTEVKSLKSTPSQDSQVRLSTIYT